MSRRQFDRSPPEQPSGRPARGFPGNLRAHPGSDCCSPSSGRWFPMTSTNSRACSPRRRPASVPLSQADRPVRRGGPARRPGGRPPRSSHGRRLWPLQSAGRNHRPPAQLGARTAGRGFLERAADAAVAAAARSARARRDHRRLSADPLGGGRPFRHRRRQAGRRPLGRSLQPGDVPAERRPARAAGPS